jgi:2-dehydro-3-deoxyphosphogluconate aldolase/(4S)-4-hydroxy-2-oxoglutarate aldolase
MPSGGVEVEEDNLRQWFTAGAACVGMGSNLFPPDIIREGKWDVLKTKLEQAYQLVQKIKTKHDCRRENKILAHHGYF